MVSQKEIIEALRAYDKAMAECGYELAVDKTIADRIESEGIAPPEGFGLVPSEPTAEMLVAWQGWREYDIPDHWPDEIRPAYGGYRAMLAAAPKGVSDEQ